MSFISIIHLINATALQGWCSGGLNITNEDRERSGNPVICQKLKGVEDLNLELWDPKPKKAPNHGLCCTIIYVKPTICVNII